MRGKLLILSALLPYLVIGQSLEDPGQAHGYFKQAESFLEESDPETAIVFFEKAAKLYAGFEMWEIYYQCQSHIIESCLEIEDFEKAKKLAKSVYWGGLDRYQGSNKQSAEAAIQLGKAYASLNRQDDAHFFFEKGLAMYQNVYGEAHEETALAKEKMGIYYLLQGDYTQALTLQQQALAIRQSLYGEQHSKVANSLFRIGDVYIRTRKFREAFQNHQQALNIRQELYGEDHDDIAQSLRQTGFIHFVKGDYNKALDYYENAVAILTRLEKPEDQSSAILYYYIAIIHLEKGSYHLGLANAQRALLINEKIGEKDFANLSSYYNCIAMANLKLRDFEQSILYFDKLLELVKTQNRENHLDASIYYNNLGIAYQKLKDYPTAIRYSKKTLSILKENLGIHHIEVAETLNNIGKIYTEMGEYDKAISYFKQIANSNATSSRDLNTVIYNFNLGDLYLRQEAYEKGASYFQESLALNSSDISISGNLFAQPSLTQLLNPFHFLSSLKGKGYCLTALGKRDQSIKYLDAAYKTYLLCDSLTDITRRSIILPDDRLNFNEASFEAYEEGIDLCLTMYEHTQDQQYLETAFQFSEKSKSNVLRQMLSEEQALMYAGVPDSTLEKEQQLKQDIQNCRKNLSHAQRIKNEKAIQYFNNQLLLLEKSRQELIDELKKDFPEYYALKFDNQVVSLAELRQKLLTDQTALVEYFIGEKKSFRFILTKDAIALEQIRGGRFLKDEFENYRKAISDFRFINHRDSARYAFTLFKETYHHLYQELFGYSLHQLDPAVNRLIIVPDGLLSYLPFDVLLQSPPEAPAQIDYTKLNYLLLDYSISYSFSATLLNQKSAQHQQSYPVSYIGFAPTYQMDYSPSRSAGGFARFTNNQIYKSLPDLPGAQKGVQTLAKLFNGRSFIGPKATEANFKLSTKSCAVLELAMHGIVEDSQPMFSKLVFTQSDDEKEDGLLNAYELYNMDFKVGLAILGACNTGLGRFKRGEGMLSMTRAFTYANCPSIVMSLWNLPDMETSNISTAFVKELAKGKNKDEALRTAKINYLQSKSVSPDRFHPYYWAALSPIGYMEAINVKTGIPLMKILLLIGLVLTLWLCFLIIRGK